LLCWSSGVAHERHHGLRRPEQKQRREGRRSLDALMQRMLHQAVEAVHPAKAVVHRMQTPEPSDPMACVVRQSEADVREDDRKHHLRCQRPLVGPRPRKADPGNGGGHRAPQRYPGEIQRLVDAGVREVTWRVALPSVPVRLVWNGPFDHERHGDGADQRGHQRPQGPNRGLRDPDPEGEESEEEQRGIGCAKPHEAVLHRCPRTLRRRERAVLKNWRIAVGLCGTRPRAGPLSACRGARRRARCAWRRTRPC
jgi:hypothetical protein